MLAGRGIAPSCILRAESHSLLLKTTAHKLVSPSPVVGPHAFALCLEEQSQAERQQCMQAACWL